MTRHSWTPGDGLARPTAPEIESADPQRTANQATTRSAAVRAIIQKLVDVLTDSLDLRHARELVAAEVSALAHQQLAAGHELLSREAQLGLVQAVLDHRYGLGPLQPLLDRTDVENIVVNGCRQTWVTFTDGAKRPGPPVAETDEDLVAWIQQLARRGANSGREFSHLNAMLDVALSDGVRMAAVHWVSRRPHLAIRVHRLVNVTLPQLTRLGTLTGPLEEVLRAAVHARRNLIVCGEVNTGKTTLLRALAGEIDAGQRIVTLESDYELFLDDERLGRHDVVALEARQANSEGIGEVSLHDLVPACLRLSPDRVIVGEARHGELAPMLEIMYSGARGSMCTLHVHRPGQVFNRVIQLGRRSGLGLSTDDLHLMFGMAEPLVIHLQRDPRTNQRYVSEVIQVGPPGDAREPTRTHLFVPGLDGRAVPAGGHIGTELLAELTEAGLDPTTLWAGEGTWS